MNAGFTRPRRFAVAIVSLICASVLFRSQIAQALVIRGDEYMFRGDRQAALERYRRALALDAHSEAAADRYVFITMQAHTHAAMARAIAVATRYLSERPQDAALRGDRALCYLYLHEYRRAESDFSKAARVSHDGRDYVFAGLAAEHAGDLSSAMAFRRAALRAEPRYAAAFIRRGDAHR
jgi:tetratricopeptide (TPR) repeat protein